MLNNLLHRFIPQSGIVRNFLVLLSGGAIAQILPALLSPVISRLYSPADFAEFAFWSNLANTIAVIATLRYELAIVLPKEDNSAKQLLKGGILISGVIAFLTFILVWISIGRFRQPALPLVIFSGLAGIYVFMVGVNQSISYWLIRKKQFHKSSINKMVQSFGLVFFTLLFGFYALSSGLVYGYVLGALGLCVFSVWQIRKAGIDFMPVNWVLINQELIQYKQFPVFNTLPALLNSFSTALPVFFVVTYFSSNESGQFAFVRQYVMVPLMFLAGLISQVYFADVAERIKNNKPILDNFIQIVKVLAGFSLLTILIFVPFGKPIFNFIFGDNWEMAGGFASVMILSIGLQFVVSPLSITLTALNKIRLLGLWQIGYFLLILTLYFFKSVPFLKFLWVLVTIDAMAYLIYFALILHAVKNYQQKNTTIS